MLKIGIVCVAAWLFMFAQTPAAAQDKVPVILETTVAPGDSLGQQFAFETKEAIRGSHGFRLVEFRPIEGERDHNSQPYINLFLIVLKHSHRNEISVANIFTYDHFDMPLDGAFITGVVQICSADAVQRCARSLLADLDRAVQILRRRMPQVMKNLR